jgi:hypothetical protein
MSAELDFSKRGPVRGVAERVPNRPPLIRRPPPSLARGDDAGGPIRRADGRGLVGLRKEPTQVDAFPSGDQCFGQVRDAVKTLMPEPLFDLGPDRHVEAIEWQRRIEERQPRDPVGMQPSERLRDPSAEVVPDQPHGAYRRVIQQGDKICAEMDDVVAAGGLSESPNPRRSSQLTLFEEP